MLFIHPSLTIIIFNIGKYNSAHWATIPTYGNNTDAYRYFQGAVVNSDQCRDVTDEYKDFVLICVLEKTILLVSLELMRLRGLFCEYIQHC